MIYEEIYTMLYSFFFLSSSKSSSPGINICYLISSEMGREKGLEAKECEHFQAGLRIWSWERMKW